MENKGEEAREGKKWKEKELTGEGTK